MAHKRSSDRGNQDGAAVRADYVDPPAVFSTPAVNDQKASDILTGVRDAAQEALAEAMIERQEPHVSNDQFLIGQSLAARRYHCR
jgi:hypothetical protein